MRKWKQCYILSKDRHNSSSNAPVWCSEMFSMTILGGASFQRSRCLRFQKRPRVLLNLLGRLVTSAGESVVGNKKLDRSEEMQRSCFAPILDLLFAPCL